MSGYLGDFAPGATIRDLWNSHGADGAAITRATDGEIRVYKDLGLTQSTAGVTDSEDFDSLTGVHGVAIDTSADGTFYSAGSDFHVVLQGATIDGKTVNAALCSFSLHNRTALRPTTAGRTLKVTATGAAAIDWGTVENPSTTVDLTGTTVKTATDVETDTQDLQGRVPAALTAGGNMKADALMLNGTGPASATIGTVTNLTNAPTNGDFTAAMKTSLNAATPASVTGSVGSVASYGTLVADLAAAVWAVLTETLTAAGTIGKFILDRIDAVLSSRLAALDYTAPDNASAASAAAAAASAAADAATLITTIGTPAGLDLVEDLTQVRLQTDQLVFPEPGKVDALASVDAEALAAAVVAAMGDVVDPLLNPVPGTYPAGSAGAALGRIGSAQIEVASPQSTAGDVVELVQGDSYVGSRALGWTITGGGWTGAASTSWSIKRRGVVTEFAPTVSAGDGSITATLELDSEDTDALAAGSYSWDLTITEGERVETPLTGTLTVRAAIAPAPVAP